jgi:hypothetical protein
MAKCSKCGSPVCKCGPLHYGDSPAKQVGVVDPLTGQPAQQMTNVPPAQANTLGSAQPVFNPQVQQAAQGIYGNVEQRQNAVNASPLFQKGYMKTTKKIPKKQYNHLEIKKELPKKVDAALDDNMKMVLEKHRRQNNQPIQEDSKITESRFKKQNEARMLETPMLKKCNKKY